MADPVLINSLEELEDLASRFISIHPNVRLFLMNGEMGAGKTTFIKKICRSLGVEGEISSPTFSIVNEYVGDKTVYHIDLYRLKDVEEALSLGIEEYLNTDAICFIEWPKLIEPLLKGDYVEVNIEECPNEARMITIERHD